MIAMKDHIDRCLSKHNADIIELRKDVDFFISSSLSPKEKVLVAGKMLDAQVELMLLGCRRAKVSCMVYNLRPNSPKLAAAFANYTKEYPTLEVSN